MAGIKSYFEESYQELVNKVTWPTWKELQEASVLVFIASLIFAGIIFLMDYVFGVNAEDSLWRGIIGFLYDLL
ncbi:MAG: preprotein translocase subunit SecE [Flavobacteriales bacterium]|uniref:preprotein translocase subunit SecE n=1 Tax=Sanyastnella coralliicola TaxID=3069118 RepID=UPI0027BB0B87|nr:preprotein translocase subunit SecE [Longitalea sp. SCSIO 12813]MCH2199339.1 preprotein translocase subunit SecE [Flavobacteriales bacterium]